MSEMTRQSEERLLAACEKMADLVMGGDTPNDALEKLARDLNLPAGHVPHLAHAYNIGRTTRVREDGSTPQEKSADFDLADAALVLKRIYPDAVKSAAIREHESGVSAEYLSAPTWYTNRRVKAGAAIVLYEKTAALADVPKAPPLPEEPTNAVRRAWNSKEARARELDAARLSVTAAQSSLFAALEKLATYFGTPGNLTIADVRQNVDIVHGKPGLAVLDYVTTLRPMLGKMAGHRRPYLFAVEPGQEPYATIDAAIKAGQALVERRTAHEKMAADNAAEDARVLAPFRNLPDGPPSILDDLEKDAGFLDAVGKGVGAGMGVEMLQGVHNAHQMGNPMKDPAIQRQLGRIATPDHEAALHAIEARAMLHDMLHHDPVISGHNPHEVTDHFNRLSNFAPHTSRHPLAAVPVLRKSLEQGSLDSFDAHELASTEHKLTEIHRPKPEHGGSHGAAKPKPAA